MHLIRTTEVPLLVTTSASPPKKVLVALDVSSATAPTLAVAQRYAGMFGAQVRVINVVELLPIIGELPPLDPEPYYQASRALIEKEVWPLVTTSGAEKTIAYGPAASTIAQEGKTWGADLIVVGSHGKGWFERVLVGSVTERLVHELPASVLVVPVSSVLTHAPVPVLAGAAAV
jgi:nucleotide-binding universal stress UspA family protein